MSGSSCGRETGPKSCMKVSRLPLLPNVVTNMHDAACSRGGRLAPQLRSVAYGPACCVGCLLSVRCVSSLPRARLLPLIDCAHDRYLKMLTLSLYFFNLLPLPFLDGGQLLDVLCDWWASRAAAGDSEAVMLSELEAASGEGEDAPVPRTTRRPVIRERAAGRPWWRKAVHVGVGALLASCVLLSMINSL